MAERLAAGARLKRKPSLSNVSYSLMSLRYIKEFTAQ